MKESIRLETLEKIREDEETLRLLEEKLRELEVLELSSEIQKYLELKKELEKIKNSQRVSKTSKKDIIRIEFIRAVNARTCTHDCWIYKGSYGEWLDPLGEHDKSFSVSSERSKEFKHNEYMCLECGKLVETEEWKEFEEENIVIKERGVSQHVIRNEYYSLLFENTSEEAIKILLEKYEISRKSLKRLNYLNYRK